MWYIQSLLFYWRWRESFKHQSQLDFAAFLQHRSNELITDGVLILSILCIDTEKSRICITYKQMYSINVLNYYWILQFLITIVQSMNALTQKYRYDKTTYVWAISSRIFDTWSISKTIYGNNACLVWFIVEISFKNQWTNGRGCEQDSRRNKKRTSGIRSLVCYSTLLIW
jgi:hypothetical protein